MEHIPHVIIVPPGVVQSIDPFQGRYLRVVIGQDLRAQLEGDADSTSGCQRRSKGYSRPHPL